jgi:hypothetical protein
LNVSFPVFRTFENGIGGYLGNLALNSANCGTSTAGIIEDKILRADFF